MTKRFNFQRLFLLMSAAGIIGFTNTVTAAGFQLWEQDGASIGNYHAGRAASAEDASTAYYNPAGLIKIHNQQIVAALDPIMTDIDFRGTVGVSTAGIGTIGPQPVVAQGGNFALIPAFHYAAPINNRLVFGLSLVAPFGLKTSYGSSTFARYAATLTSLQVADLSPSLGFAVNDKLSLGAGFDFEHVRGEFDANAGNPILNTVFGTNMESTSQNVGTSNGYGYHLGILYQFTEQTRVGLAYISQIRHHLRGSSKFVGPLANNLAGGYQSSGQLKTDVTLPGTATLSIFHMINPAWDFLGSLSYTQWNVFENLVLRNVSGLSGGASSNTIVAVIPESYRNTWNLSLGGNYHASEQFMFRGALGFDQSPTNNKYRNLQLPDSDRIVFALGGHYQHTNTLGFDLGWTHYLAMNSRINNLSQSLGDQTTVTSGSVQLSADVIGVQVKWDIV
ncbi:MAG: outer membrane protein transport protein [Gammaproteobacteria bacterium]